MHSISSSSIRKGIALSLAFLFFAALLQAQNQVYTYAGRGSAGYVDGDTSVARFDTPHGIALDNAGNVYVADGGNHVIRKVSTNGMVSTYAGTGVAGYLDGPAGQAQFNEPYNLCVDSSGNVFVTDFLNQRVRKVSPNGMVSTVAGNGIPGYLDGPDTSAQFNYPRGICVDGAGNLYVGDSWNHRIRKVDPSGLVTTYAGGGATIGVQSVGSFVDGPDTSARFYTPTEVSIDAAGTLFVADAFNHRIRRVDVQRNVSTLAGSGVSGSTGGGFQNGPGNQALFKTPTACFAGQDGMVYVGDGSSHRVRQIDSTGLVSTFAGSGFPGYLDGPAATASFNFPRATVLDAALDRLYVVDANNHTLRYVQMGLANGLSIAWNTPVRFYPNPFRDKLAIDLEGEAGKICVEVYNALGECVFRREMPLSTRMELDLGQLPSGPILVVLRGEDGRRLAKRLVKVAP